MSTEPPPNHNDYLRTYLASFDSPCPGCGYSLRGLTATRCPECNQELKLQVGLVEPKIGAFIAGLVGVGMGTGFCVLLLAYAIYWGFFSGSRAGPPPEFIISVLVGSVVGAGLLTGWLLLRRRLTRMSTGPRWGLAALFAAGAMVCPIWFILSVR